MRFGRNVDLIIPDERQYRANQPCGDAGLAEPCADLDDPRAFLGRRQMSFVKKRLSSSRAAWKVIANEVMIMPTIYPGGQYIGFDSWQGYPRERKELLQHIRREKIKDVVFVTGDIHTFVAGDVRVTGDDKRPVATEFVGGSITSQQANPWVKNADLDHHGYGLVKASSKSFRCTLRRVDTVKRASTRALPTDGYAYQVHRGHPSILG
jgi:alkaline phosphatase D